MQFLALSTNGTYSILKPLGPFAELRLLQPRALRFLNTIDPYVGLFHSHANEYLSLSYCVIPRSLVFNFPVTTVMKYKQILCGKPVWKGLAWTYWLKSCFGHWVALISASLFLTEWSKELNIHYGERFLRHFFLVQGFIWGWYSTPYWGQMITVKG